MASAVSSRSVPRAFVWRRLHSLTGLWFLIFLLEHMFTNSQAAIFFGNNVMWFVNSVNFLHSIPYLPVVEIILLGVPMALHAVWGVWYMLTSQSNVRSKRGKASCQKYERNWAYSMQRISAWIILVGIIFHVVQMRFLLYPVKVHMGNHSESFGVYKVDPGLYKVCDQLGVTIYDSDAIKREEANLERKRSKISLVDKRYQEMKDNGELERSKYNEETSQVYQNLQEYREMEKFIYGLTYFSLKPGEVIVTSKKSADMILLNVRQVFQSVWVCLLYTLFVLAAVLHGCNGFWTFCVTWGLILSKNSQSSWVHFAYGLAFILVGLGMLSIWGSYFFSTGYFN